MCHSQETSNSIFFFLCWQLYLLEIKQNLIMVKYGHNYAGLNSPWHVL